MLMNSVSFLEFSYFLYLYTETMSTRIKQQKSESPVSHVVSSTTNVQIISKTLSL